MYTDKKNSALSGYINTEQMKTRKAIYNYIKVVGDLPDTTVVPNEDFTIISINAVHEFIPNFELKWSNKMKHFRCYILLADRVYVKGNTGYAICVIKSKLVATGFVMLYQFLHKNRANRKDMNN